MLKHNIGDAVDIFAVVKANAYGHGAGKIAKAALNERANRVIVHRMIEGVELGKAGIEAPILVMYYTPPNGAPRIVEANLTPSVIIREFAQTLYYYARSIKKTRFTLNSTQE